MQKILVTIAGYYERFQINTMESCLKRAKHPERISFAIAYHEDHVIDTSHINARVSKYIIPNGDKVGVQKPKNILSKMIQDEDFILSIDSHVIMMQDWDEELIKDYEDRVNSAENKNIVISGNFGNSVQVGDLDYHKCLDEYFNNDKFFNEKITNAVEEFIVDGDMRTWDDVKDADYYQVVLNSIPFLTHGHGDNIRELNNIYSGNFSFYPKAWFDKYNFSEEIFFAGDQPETAMNIYTSGYDIWMPRYKYHIHMVDHSSTRPGVSFEYNGKTFYANRYFDINKDIAGANWFLKVINQGYGDERPRSVDDFFNFFKLNKEIYKNVRI